MIYLNGLYALSSLGETEQEQIDTLKSNKSKYLREISGYLPNGAKAVLGKLSFIKQSELNRNYVLSLECLKYLDDIIQKVKAEFCSNRIALIIGSSTALIREIEQRAKLTFNKEENTIAYDEQLYEIGAISSFLKDKLNIAGPAYTIATACSSASRAIISGARLLESNVADAVIVGAVDNLSSTTVSGFHALGALSTEQTIPFNKNRHGINIGEGVGFCVMSKKAFEEKPLKLIGYGSSSDGHHISAPCENGDIAIEAVKEALEMANLQPDDIGYINLHGTGTKLNDQMEGNIVRKIFKDKTFVSTSKHLTGHTLAAAGIVEAFIVKLILKHNLCLPYQDYAYDDFKEEFGDINLVCQKDIYPSSSIIMSNNFAFGGNNTSLIFTL